MLTLYNTLSRKKELFQPLHDKNVGMYTCGPTVYHYAHLGNLRTYIFEDILKRTLRANDYTVNHIMNITDVGHLTDDADQGEDKMEKGARREGKSAWDIAAFYTDAFKHDLVDLNILPPDTWCKATDHIPEQIALVQTLIDKGYTYETTDGIYFDTTKLSDYGKLALLEKQALKAGARITIGEKKHAHDFALWKFTATGEKRQMEWHAFGRMGFPGWHIECSAMSMKYLGEEFDIHCGGIDHIPVHHTNEIAQSEAATGKKPWVKYWLHGEFLTIGEEKMAKSGENFLTLQTLKDKGVSPLAYRYFCLQAHYRRQLTFSWDALQAAEQGLLRLREHVAKLPPNIDGSIDQWKKIMAPLNDDLNTPEALGLLWNTVKEATIDKKTIRRCDEILGLRLEEPLPTITIPEKVQELLDARHRARVEKNWEESDHLRDEIEKLGFTIDDTPHGQDVQKK